MKESSKGYNPYFEARVLVLGAAGFIGRWVARALCARGAQVSLAVSNKVLAGHIFHAYDIRGDVFEVDLENLDVVTELLEKLQPSISFNLSGYGMDRSERDPSPAYQINTHLLEILLRTIAARQERVWPGQRLVHVGSPLEYGAIGGNLSEDSISNPTTLYGKSKLAGTQLLAHFCKNHNFKGLTARPFTVYGPGEPGGRLLPSLIQISKTGTPLQLTSGEQKRDFVYVEDVSEGLLRLGLAPAAPGDIVNLATGRLTSVRSFAETAAKIMGIPQDRLRFGEIPSLAEEMHHSEVTTERLRQLTAWIPSTGIAEGIRNTLERISVLSLPAGSLYSASNYLADGTKL